MPRDRGAEQGDVAGPFGCSLASGMVAAEARMCVDMQQAARTLTGIGAGDSLHERRLQDEQRNRRQWIRNFQLGGSEKLSRATIRDTLCRKETGGLADQWYLDDGDILCHPLLVLLRSTSFQRSSRVNESNSEPPSKLWSFPRVSVVAVRLP